MATQHTLSLQGKQIFVAGGSRGIGAEIAKALAAQGGSVVLGYASRKDAALEVVASIKKETPSAQVEVVGGDLSSAAGAHSIAKDILAKTGGSLDILVLTSGFSEMKDLSHLTQESWDKHMNTNITGPIFLVQALLPSIRADGRIIFFSTSLCAHPAAIGPGYLPYVASKGCLEQALRVLARDPSITGAERRITVNAIAPGPVNTELFLKGKTPEIVDRIKSLVPRNRIGEVDDIVGPVLYLASPLSKWVNGQVLRINGGMTT
ncbi:hypothetical protein CF327_g4314 [Tilletia walkeri]|nr:hypothetical protein CF327_g4314 [Tilletia walkeri]